MFAPRLDIDDPAWYDGCMNELELTKLETRQTSILALLRAMLRSDDPDSADILHLATELRSNDDRINEILLDTPPSA